MIIQKGRPIKSFIVRKDVKDHGTKSAVEGNVRPGERVAINDNRSSCMIGRDLSGL